MFKNTRLPTRQELSTIIGYIAQPKYYKVAHVHNQEKGLYRSCWAGHPISKGQYQGLCYTQGRVTIAPKYTRGLFIYTDLEFALSHAAGTADILIEPPCTVLEVIPLSPVREDAMESFSSITMYTKTRYTDSLYVLGEYQPAPIEEWVDITADCLSGYYNGMFALQYKGYEFAQFGLGDCLVVDGYKVKKGERDCSDNFNIFKAYKRETQ
uniref:Uncharacterized protein n=1 Tax=viral metagenome TaxID=1070528 RepID=A0A6M3KYY2_9ZZZZ